MLWIIQNHITLDTIRGSALENIDNIKFVENTL